MAITVEQVLSKHPDVVSGILKFKDRVPVGALIDFCNLWLEEEPDRLLSVAVRGCAKDMNGIDFRYRFEEESHKKLLHALGRRLEDRFGKQNFCGWSVSSPTYIIK